MSLIYIDGTEIKVSWTQEVKKATTGDRSVALYDTEGFTALRKSRALGQVGQGKLTKLHPATYQASTVSPLVTIVIPYPGSYSGPWLNSEHLAAALAAAVFYLAFSSRYWIGKTKSCLLLWVVACDIERLHNVILTPKCIAAHCRVKTHSWLMM